MAVLALLRFMPFWRLSTKNTSFCFNVYWNFFFFKTNVFGHGRVLEIDFGLNVDILGKRISAYIQVLNLSITAMFRSKAGCWSWNVRVVWCDTWHTGLSQIHWLAVCWFVKASHLATPLYALLMWLLPWYHFFSQTHIMSLPVLLKRCAPAKTRVLSYSLK